MFDINDLTTFQHVEDWVAELERNGGTMAKILVGNKRDLNKRQVNRDDAENLAYRMDAPYFETT